MEFEKAEKKIARKVIDLGIAREYETGLLLVERIINEWKSSNLDAKEAYLKLWKELPDHDKGIEDRYDRLSGSRYAECIAIQLALGIVQEEDLSEFSASTREYLLAYAERLKD